MGPAHRAAAAPLGLSLAILAPWGSSMPAAEWTADALVGWIDRAIGTAIVPWAAGLLFLVFEIVVHLALGLAVVGCAKWNDLDHPRFKGSRHPGAAFVRLTARLGYRIRTSRDRVRSDLHRGPSHCLEWCVLAGLATVRITAWVPWLAPWAWWWGLAVFLGTSSHVWIDALTPSGVPVSPLWNVLAGAMRDARDRAKALAAGEPAPEGTNVEVWRRHAFAWKTTELRVRAPWPMVATVAPVMAGHPANAVDQEPVPMTLPALVAHLVSPGVRATTRVELAWHTFTPRVPRVGMMPVDEKAPGCQPGLVGTDTGAEHFILVPLLHGATLAAGLASVGLLWPLIVWLTS